MKLLLHTCCAPCLIYPLERLSQENFKTVGFFYNPNIHPFAEYHRRKSALAELSNQFKANIIYPEYRPEEFFQSVNLKESKPPRCSLCWTLRLKATASLAKKEGFEYFSTTLLVSPYQDQELLRKIGYEIADDLKIEFYYRDFRDGFKKAHDQAKANGVYTQKYCGCIYSEIERCKGLAKH